MRRSQLSAVRSRAPWIAAVAVAWAVVLSTGVSTRADDGTVVAASSSQGDAGGSGPAVPFAGPPLEGTTFEGFGLGGFDGVGSIAAELRRMQAESATEEAWGIDMAVSGPGGGLRSKLSGDPSAPPPLRAIVGRSISGLDLSAGVDADPGTIQSGPSRWIGGVKVASEGSLGRAELALRTSVRYAEASRLIGLELGPRFERNFPGGLTFFIDGKAEAETGPPGQQPMLPTSSFDTLGGMNFGSMGVVGRAGIVR